MSRIFTKKSTLLLCLMFAIFAGAMIMLFGLKPNISFASAEAIDHSVCETSEDYCLVCDVAEKVNSLPEKEAITIENSAEVIQQIHDIDRIKYDLTDQQFEELVALVDTHDDGVDHFVLTKYKNGGNFNGKMACRHYR